jgi:hypothetical protein
MLAGVRLNLVEAEATNRGHAVVEQVVADLKNGALAHLPSGRFTANAALLALACLAFNQGRATTATVRGQLVGIPARLAHPARGQVLHLPADWPWHNAAAGLFDTLHAPPPAA